MTDGMQALILAGGRPSKTLRSETSSQWEALLPIHGRPMVSYVIAALAAHPRVRHIRVVGPPAPTDSGVEFVPPGDGNLWDSLEQGLRGWAPDESVLIATADIPLITAPIVERFLAQCPEREVVYAVVPQGVTERRFPGVRRTYFRLREGSFTGGNLFVARPGAILRARRHAERLLAHRKQPWLLAGDIGLGTLVKFLLRRLSLRDAERMAGRLLGIDGAAVICEDPEVGVDVDKLSDLHVVLRVLAPEEGESHHA